MIVAERIKERVEKLPIPLQTEVLELVERLLDKAEEKMARQEEIEWADLSLESALRDMPDDEEPVYTDADLKIRFK